MAPKEYLPDDKKLNIVHDDGDEIYWKAAEEKRIRESILSSYTDRFKIMMRLMRIDNMLSRAKVTHKKLD
jgi:hypothetical protein